MPATSTFRTLLEEVVEQTGVGYVLPEIDPDDVIAGQLTLASSYGSGPWANKFPRGSPIMLTDPADGGTATASTTTTITDSSKAWTTSEWINFVVRMGGRRALITANTATALTFGALDAAPTVGSYTIAYPEAGVDNHTPSTGVITVLPAWGATDAAQVKPFSALVFKLGMGIDHPDRVKECVNRALTDHCYRWEPRPLTFVPDGDLQGATVTDYWTAAANGTAAYVTAQVFPATGAVDAFGQVGVNRVLQLTSAGGSTSMDGNGMRWPISTSQRTWYFQAAIRLVSGTGTASLVMRDNTNAADITLQVSRGNDSNTLTTTTLGDFMICEGTFQMPATCVEVAPRLVLSATGMVMQMAPIVMFPVGVYRFPLPNRIRSEDDIGNVRWAMAFMGPSGLADMDFSDPLTNSESPYRIDDYGDHMTLRLPFRATRAVYYDEAVFGAALTAMTDTTTFPRDRVVRWAVWELYRYLAKHDPTVLDPSKRPVTSPWVRKANAAKRGAEMSGFEPEPVTVNGRR